MRRFGERHAPPLGEELYGLREIYLFVEHHELERIASRLAAEAIEELHLRIDGERRGLFVMERTQALEPVPCGLERHVVRNEANDIARIPNRRDEIFRERDGQLGHLPGPIRGGLPTAPGRK